MIIVLLAMAALSSQSACDSATVAGAIEGQPSAVIGVVECRSSRDEPSSVNALPSSPPPPLPPPTGCTIENGEQRCFGISPGVADPVEVTPGDVETAVREVGLPKLAVSIQPGGRTLVNVETILFTTPVVFEPTVTLLGQTVDLRAEPSSYRWNHGDGTTATTTSPGQPYPRQTVTHQFREVADAVNVSVDVTYRVTYRINGGAWQTLDSSIVASGPSAALAVAEAAPVLVAP